MTRLLSLLFAAVVGSSCCHSAVLTFEDFGEPPSRLPRRDYFMEIRVANLLSGKESYEYGGVVWDDRWALVGDQFIVDHNDSSDWFQEDGRVPFAQPHSGHFAIFPQQGLGGLGLSTTQYLAGVWFSRPRMTNEHGGASWVTVVALSNSTALAAVSLNLTNTKPAFMDTSVFLEYTGITRYRIDRIESPGGGSDRGYFIADDFHFVPTRPPRQKEE